MNKKSLVLFFIHAFYLSAYDQNKRFNELRMIMTHNSTSLRPGKNLLGDMLRNIVMHYPLSEELRTKALNAIQRITLINPNPVADQVFGITQQLRDGVRAFKLPLSLCSDEFRVCHTVPKSKAEELYKEANDTLHKFIPIKKLRTLLLYPLEKFRDNPCLIDTTNVPLKPLLKDFNAWLDRHPQEVLTFFFDFSQFSGAMEKANLKTIEKLLQNTGFIQKMYLHKPGAQWPYISEMIKNNKRLVIMANTEGFESLGILHKKKLGFGSTYNYKNLNELANDSKKPRIDWGSVSKNNLLIVDNYTTPLISGNIIDAKVANSYHVLKYRLKKYEGLTQHLVNFVMVDFYHEPFKDIFKVIEDLNKNK